MGTMGFRSLEGTKKVKNDECHMEAHDPKILFRLGKCLSWKRVKNVISSLLIIFSLIMMLEHRVDFRT